MSSYIGRSSDGFGLLRKYRWVASGSETSIAPTLADSNGKLLRFTDKNLVHLFLNGVKLDQTDFNLNTANTISGLSALATSDVLEAHVYDVFSVATTDTVSATDGGTFSGAITANSTLDMNGTELILDADGDSSIHSSTDDQIDIKVGGNDTAIVTADTVKIRSDNASLVFRRTTSEADIAKIQYVNGNPSLDIGADGKNVRFTNGGSYAETMRVGTNGDITIQTGDIVFGTAGKGINLGVTSNTDANTLDDYEEGTYTLSMNSFSFQTNSTGRYIKIGKFVHFTAFIHASGSQNSNTANLDLPFTIDANAASSNTGYYTIAMGFQSSHNTDDGTHPSVFMATGGNSYVTLRLQQEDGARSNAANDVFSSEDTMVVSGMYIASA